MSESRARTFAARLRAARPDIAAALAVVVALAFPAHAEETDFDTWLAAFRDEAQAQGISPATLASALDGIEPVERVIELDRRQPEFLQTFAAYLARRVTSEQVDRGQTMLEAHADLFDAVETRYGVAANVLAAFWGLETRYGAFKGGLNIPASLATLAYDGRRSAFFRKELLDALRIIDAGHVTAPEMNGSWAGAMGHMQFMPSTFRAYAVDADGDARIDLWQSLPDAMNSAANYLSRAGWRSGEPIAVEVTLPPDFDLRKARAGHRQPVADWAAAGVRAASGCTLPQVNGKAGIVLPQGWEGPAFMVFDNFDVVMRWNRSVSYALTVAQLAQQLADGDGLVHPAVEEAALSLVQVKLLQQALNELGFDAGEPDGVLGPQTQAALRRYQVVHALPADGYPGSAVMAHVARTHAAAFPRAEPEPEAEPPSFDVNPH
ncbi:lytic murein transglycosylase [Thiobacillus denitrificans ATCC 25259]|uniref:Lytic murein transglycosylase n=1 Tax=Thiobacillus denitrificans (strain ATCC 25259 / T1) TaxID=292415 RepID=Q3SMM9_THIDA|nr:lytic murein transglycosylase [Thiobacillus denitrificans]AAZ96014.1 lytic murein transglycosylase [Thiobacillus denitrificans ATCC 25259]